MSHTIVDVTQLAEWTGKLTGIPRLMNELSVRFIERGDCVLVVWDRNSKSFREIVYEDIKRPNGIGPNPQPETSKSLLKNVVRSIEAHSQPAYRIRKRIQTALDGANTRPALAKSSPVKVHKDDVFVALWGSWDDQNYIDRLVEFKSNGLKLVQFVHDMLPLLAPQFSGHSTISLGNYAGTVYPKCDLILAISEYTSKDLTAWLEAQHLKVPKIRVVRIGDDFIASKPEKPKDKLFTDANIKTGKYILCVGTLEARKNHTLLYYVYKLANQQGLDLPRIVVVGRRGWLTDDIFTLINEDPEVNRKFIFLQNASDEELSWLYDNCLFSIYPSFYEGWGLPIAEAVAHGAPCLASNTSSMPEIAGNLVDYFSPFSSQDCLDGILRLLDPAYYIKAKERVKRYSPKSWDQTYESVNMYIKEL